MGKVTFTPKQRLIFDEVKKSDFIRQNFYFTGGTALSSVYLHHRLSEDLDFFSVEKFDPLAILNLVTQWSEIHNFKVTSQELEVVRVFILEFKDKEKLKVDFGYYPYNRLEKGQKIDSFNVDSLLDIGVNKLQTIHQRTDVKDFVDLYFLLREFTVWDLMEGVRVKFKTELEPYTVAADYLKVDSFEYLPTMLTPLDLATLQKFFQDRAVKLSEQVVK